MAEERERNPQVYDWQFHQVERRMATLPWVKYDNGPAGGQPSLSDLPANCFPVRNLLRSSSSNRKSFLSSPTGWKFHTCIFSSICFKEQWVVALRDTEQRRFAAILTTLSSPTPFEADITQAEAKKRERWSGKEKIVDHLLDGFFIVSI